MSPKEPISHRIVKSKNFYKQAFTQFTFANQNLGLEHLFGLYKIKTHPAHWKPSSLSKTSTYPPLPFFLFNSARKPNNVGEDAATNHLSKRRHRSFFLHFSISQSSFVAFSFSVFFCNFFRILWISFSRLGGHLSPCPPSWLRLCVGPRRIQVCWDLDLHRK